jgi:hypothetical protein
VQLNRLASALGVLTAELLAATCAQAKDAKPAQPPVDRPAPGAAGADAINDETESDLGKVRVDSSVLFYKEQDGRVQAVEPVVGVTYNGQSGDVLSVQLTSDTLTGASPVGLAPLPGQQSFLRGGSLTSASSLVKIPANTLPLDPAFKDQRYAADIGYSFLLGTETRLSLSGGYSHENDYESWTGGLGIARDFNQKNTTVSLSANIEQDRSFPIQQTPQPLTLLAAAARTGPQDSKTVRGLVLGLTQVLSRTWLVQLNYSYGQSQGYQNDPYRLITMINTAPPAPGQLPGAPIAYYYEGRPRARTRESVYLGSKLALGPMVLDASTRAYRDSWGIRSVTLQVADRVALGPRLFAEPSLRYYHQSAASFFRYYLVRGQPLPDYVSPDIRLSDFAATTVGLKLGMKLRRTDEIYIRGDYYRQYGASNVANPPAAVAGQNLFSGVKATSVIVGYSFVFG